jgi:dipeptidase E
VRQSIVENGTILSGLSAGANCWFKQCSTDSIPTDSIPGEFSALSCSGIIPGSFCPHYNGETERRPSLHQLLRENKIGNGYAADDGAAAHFVNGHLLSAISSRPHSKIYQVDMIDKQVVEKTIETRYLGD